MWDPLNCLTNYSRAPKRIKIYQNNNKGKKLLASYTVSGKKTSLWSIGGEKKLYMNLKGGRLFIFTLSGCGEDEICLQKEKKNVEIRKSDKREILRNLQEIINKNDNYKDVIRTIYNITKTLPVSK